MDAGFINLTPENLDGEHLCCIIRSKKAHPGVEAKRQWLADRLKEGHIFRKLNAKATVFIEYAPLETAWTPVLGDSYYYIYCLWVCGESKGKGYGRALMEYCLADARAKGKSGVCMLGAEKQKAWLSDQAFAKKFGFQTVDTAPNGYELLALSFDGTKPRFAPHAKKQQIENKELTVFYDMQCRISFSAWSGWNGTAGRTACRCPSSGWIRCKRRRSCLVFSTTGPYFTKESLKP